MANKSGILIVFEGIDGSGKTTQAELLEEAFGRTDEKVIVSKEPTDGPWGRKIRESAHISRLPPEEELEAFVNDRIEHIDQLIRPALDDGQIVILDRYYHSTIAYQGARGMDVESLIRKMDSIAIEPDVTFILDLDVDAALARINGRDTPNKFERATTLEKCRKIYKTLVDREPTARKVDAHSPIDQIHYDIVNELVSNTIREKRCANTDCKESEDEFYCTPRLTGACEWWNVREALLLKLDKPESTVKAVAAE